MTRYDGPSPEAEQNNADGAHPQGPCVIEARNVPLGGIRAMTVKRTLPHKRLPTIGPWCFVDRFFTHETVAMQVAPHPHIGLQTVTWPLSGLVRHRDSVGSDVVLRPGELNVMTAGWGISHSEYSLESGTGPLDGVQLWVALPSHSRDVAPLFENHAHLPQVTLPALKGANSTATVFMGSLGMVSSPATTYSPLVGAFLDVRGDSEFVLHVEAGWEHGVIVLHGDAVLTGESDGSVDAPLSLRDGSPSAPEIDDMTYFPPGWSRLRVSSKSGAKLLLIGGTPWNEPLVMWWNFVGPDHQTIAQARSDWENRSARFGQVVGHGGERIPAPPMPPVTLKPRIRQ